MMNKIKFTSVFVAVVLLNATCLFPSNSILTRTEAHAWVESAIGPATAIGVTYFGGKKLEDIVKQFKQTGTNLIGQAELSGNGLISRGANEAQVLAENVNFMLRDRLGDVFDKLDDKSKQFIVEAELYRRELEKLKDGAYDIKDTLALDMNAAVEKLPFSRRQDKFFIQAIRGLAFMPQGGDYEIIVYASTLGIKDTDNTEVSVKLDLGHGLEPVQDIRVDQSQQRFQALIKIPNKVLVGFHDKSNPEIHIVKGELAFKLKHKAKFFNIGGSENSYTVPVYLTFYPEVAGTATINAKRPTYRWLPMGQIAVSKMTPDRHCTSKCKGKGNYPPTRGSDELELVVAGGGEPFKPGYQKLSNPKRDCVGPNNNQNLCSGWYEKMPLLQTNFDTKVIANWDTWTHSTYWRLTADVSEWKQVSEDDIPASTYYFRFDEPFIFSLPKDWTLGLMSISTFNKYTYKIVIGSPDPYHLLQYGGKIPGGNDNERIVYYVAPPVALREPFAKLAQ